MARVLLISYSGYIKTPSSLALDNGLANLAGSLIRRGHYARIRDFNNIDILERMTPKGLSSRAASVLAAPDAEERLSRMRELQDHLDQQQTQVVDEIFEEMATEIERNSIDTLGFKCWGSEGAFAIRRWCELVRSRFPAVRILLGGPVCEVMPEEAAHFFRHFDAMATSEAERTIVYLAEESRATFDRIPGVLFFRNNRLIKTPINLIPQLDELPFPSYTPDVYPDAWTGSKLNLVVLDESRGCPNRCHFCVHPTYAGGRRTKSTDRLMAEVRSIQQSLGTRYFRFAGSNSPPQLLDDFSQRVLDSGVDVRFSAFVHVDGIRPGSAARLKAAGLECTFSGIESADEQVLARAAGKCVPTELAEAGIRALNREGIFCTGSFIYPLPFETSASRSKTIEFVRRVFGNNPLASAIFLNPAPLPGTQWWTQKQKYGFEFDDEELCKKTITLSVRHLFPPEMQDLLPYKLNGKNHAELAQDLGTLMQELASDNVLFNVSDDVAIIAYGAGTTPSRLREEMIPAFMTGDLSRIRALVRAFNDNRCQAPGRVSLPNTARSALVRSPG